jgi:uncharacterized membrane protein
MMSSNVMSTASTVDGLARKARLFSILTLVQLALLLLLFAVWYLLYLPPHVNGWLILGFHALPLLAFLPGLLRNKPRVFIWLCFFILLYFCEGVISAFALPHVTGVLGLLEALLTSGLFVAAMLAARFLAQLQKP